MSFDRAQLIVAAPLGAGPFEIGCDRACPAALGEIRPIEVERTAAVSPREYLGPVAEAPEEVWQLGALQRPPIMDNLRRALEDDADARGRVVSLSAGCPPRGRRCGTHRR